MKNLICHLLLFMMISAQTEAQETAVRAVEWKILASLPPPDGAQDAPGLAGPVTGLHDDILLVAGGANFPDGMPWLGGKKKYYSEGYIFKLNSASQAKLAGSFRLGFPLAYGANCSTPQGIISVGGENEQGVSAKAFLLAWNDAPGQVVIQHLPDLPIAVANATLCAAGNSIFLAGGETKSGVSDQLFMLDLSNPATGWKTMPSLPHPVSHAVMVAISKDNDQAIYLMGGRKRNSGAVSDLYTDVYQFDIEKGAWTAKKSLPYALSAGTGVAATDNTILLFGGDRGETFHQTESLIAAIATETDSLKKQSLNAQKVRLQSAHPGFHKSVLAYNTVKDDWQVIGNIPFDTPVTTTAIRWNEGVIIPSGEIRAGVRTPHILLGKFCLEKTGSAKTKTAGH